MMKSIKSPAELRDLIRTREWTLPTSGAAQGCVQANLVMLPRSEAFNFLLFCIRNPKPCPILDVLERICGAICPVIVFSKTGNSKRNRKMSPIYSMTIW